MAKLSEIVKFLDDYLKISDFKDSAYNGLQFEGKPEVEKVLFAVDAGLDTFETAIAEKADMIIVHHGLFWKGTDPCIKGYHKQRIKFLAKHDISLYACHLPLDAHPKTGNNARLLLLLNCAIKKEFGIYNDQKISFSGELRSPLFVDDIEQQLNRELSTDCITLAFGKKEIKTLAVCTGGAGSSMVQQAIDEGVDCYITGEPTEVFHVAKDAKINIIFAGHHATETLGVKALSKIAEEKLGIKAVFVDIPTGI